MKCQSAMEIQNCSWANVDDSTDINYNSRMVDNGFTMMRLVLFFPKKWAAPPGLVNFFESLYDPSNLVELVAATEYQLWDDVPWHWTHREYG